MRERGGNVTDTQGATVGAQDHHTTPTEDRKWEQAYWKARRTRLQRVQASASVWLGVLTTLLGLVGSVVLFKGGDLVTEVTATRWLQLVLIALVAAVFFFAVLAVIAGGVATWGGLKDIVPQTSDSSADASNGVDSQHDNPEPQKVRQTSDSSADASNGVDSQHDNPEPRNTLEKRFAKLALRLAWIRDDEREEALHLFDKPDSSEKEKPPYKQYEDNIETNAERNRIYLHASRTLGVLAAFFIAVLAIVAITVGTFAPVPSDVVVVYHGRFTCVPVSDSAKYMGVTQVISVSGC
jgi:hypothetical protein